MYVTVEIKTGNRTFTTPALIDSGASVNLLNSKYLTDEKRKAANLYLASGEEMKGVEILRNKMLVKPEGNEPTYQSFYASSDMVNYCILGMPWLVAKQPKTIWGKSVNTLTKNIKSSQHITIDETPDQTNTDETAKILKNTQEIL
jgi:hypothetical protein